MPTHHTDTEVPAEDEESIFSPLPPDWPFLGPPSRPGDYGTLGPYRVLGLLGEGGMGYVFRGFDDALGRPVALKVMRPELTVSRMAKARFLREGRSVARLKSDHVVVVHATGGAGPGEAPYLVMEALAGRTLGRLLYDYGGRATPAAAALVGRHTLRGLAAVHARGLIHRDIKPSNLWVEHPSGRVKLLDFGVVQDSADRRRVTVPGQVLGTVAYMSVEQALGGPVDPRADLYSLGVVMYQMLVGRNPFDRRTYHESLFAVHGLTPPPAAEAAPGVPPELSEFVATLMSKDRDGRPPDALTALAGLEAAVRRMKADPGGDDPPTSRPGAVRVEAPTPAPTDGRVVVSPPRAGGEEAEVEVAPGLRLRFCWVPAGTARLGSPRDEQDYITRKFFDNKRPAWMDDEAEEARGWFTTSGFWLAKATVTQAEWVGVTGSANPSYFDGVKGNELKGADAGRFPVDSVSWNDAVEFCNRASALAGRTPWYRKVGPRWVAVESADGFRLPHEDEWEYACRGYFGNGRPFHFGAALDGGQANCDGNVPYGPGGPGPYRGRPCEVDDTNDGSYRKHPWGLCHMHGNVSEWCHNPCPRSARHRVLRGGSWLDNAFDCRAASRGRGTPDFRTYYFGFRLFLPRI